MPEQILELLVCDHRIYRICLVTGTLKHAIISTPSLLYSQRDKLEYLRGAAMVVKCAMYFV
jgi:hypothetical protein